MKYTYPDVWNKVRQELTRMGKDGRVHDLICSKQFVKKKLQKASEICRRQSCLGDKL